jgi:integrase
MAIITDKQMQSKATAKDRWLTEAAPKGMGRLVGRITPTGERLFYYRYTTEDRKRVRMPIGAYDPEGKLGMSLKEARSKYAELATIYNSGVKNLREHLNEQRADETAKVENDRKQKQLEVQRQLTVRQVFDRWAAVELKPHQRSDGQRSGRKDGGAFVKGQFERRLFPNFGDLPIEKITKADVLSVIDAAKSEGKLRTCNVLLSTIKQMFRFAHAREIIGQNPIQHITKRDAGGRDVERDRYLSEEEICTLNNKLVTSGLSTRNKAAIWFILATACRVGELLNARWEDFNITERKWHLSTSKNSRPHTIHLSKFAIDNLSVLTMFREVSSVGKPSPWLFTNRTGTGPVSDKYLGKQITDRQRAIKGPINGRTTNVQGLQLPEGRWTPHDLRRTAATLMAQLGISTDVIDECLNHMLQSKISRIYIRDRRESEQVKAFDALGERLEMLTGNTPASNLFILPIAA